jgi:hypothetical protein
LEAADDPVHFLCTRCGADTGEDRIVLCFAPAVADVDTEVEPAPGVEWRRRSLVARQIGGTRAAGCERHRGGGGEQCKLDEPHVDISRREYRVEEGRDLREIDNWKSSNL